MNSTWRATLLSCVIAAWRFRGSVGQVNDACTFCGRSTTERIGVNHVGLMLVQHRSWCLRWRRLELSVFGITLLLNVRRIGRAHILILTGEHGLTVLKVAIFSSNGITKLLQSLSLDVKALGEVDLFRVIAEEDERFKGRDRVCLLVNPPKDVVEERLQSSGNAGAG